MTPAAALPAKGAIARPVQLALGVANALLAMLFAATVAVPLAEIVL